MRTPKFFGAGLLFSALLLSQSPAREDEYVEGEVILTLKAGVREGGAAAVLKRHSLGFVRRYHGLAGRQKRLSGTVRGSRSTAEMVRELSGDADVEAAEPDYLRRISAAAPNDARYADLWGLHNTGQTVNSTAGTAGVDIKFPEAWKLAKAAVSGEVVVAVVDSGVNITHPDLINNIWTNTGEIPGNHIDDDGNGFVDDIHGYDFANVTASLTDSGFHGTHVAGTIAAQANNGIGVLGAQPHAKILPLKVSSDGENMATSAILSALDYAMTLKERGVNIVAVNASYGGESSTTAERRAIEALRDAGILLCAAAGNDGTNNDTTPVYPACYPTENIISVAAVDQTGALADFSDYGASTVDLAAPGVNIYSTSPPYTTTVTTVTVEGTTYPTAPLEFSGETGVAGVSGTLYQCGIGNPAEFSSGVRGNIALIQRGTLTFAQKVTNAKNAGAVAVIIYNNVAEPLEAGPWTLGAAGAWIPAAQITQASGQAILRDLTASSTATVANYPDSTANYRFLDGTSMAAPHVSAAVAFAALNFPNESMTARRARILNGVTKLGSLTGKMVTGGMLNLLGIVDAGGDGLPDWWRGVLTNALVADGVSDADNDGFTNRQELLAGTDPTVADEHPRFDAFAREGNDFTLSYRAAPDLSYQAEWSDDPAAESWHALGAAVSGDGEPVTITDTGAVSGSSRRFYRLRVEEE